MGPECLSLTLRENHGLKVFEQVADENCWDDISHGWRKLLNVELDNLYPTSNKMTTIKSRRMIRAGQLALMGKRGMHIEFWWESEKGRDRQEDLDIDGRIMFRLDLET
jgi:hypothetical protein